jgi:gliding motility-associated-like protein
MKYIKLIILLLIACSLKGQTLEADIYEEPTIYAPNAFTPDADGTNDAWYIKTNDTDTWDDISVSIFNTWGELVWSTNNFDEGWVGQKYEGTHYSPDGIYLYMIAARHGTDYVKKTGIIHMIR